MFGIIVVFIGDFFREVGASMSKDGIAQKKEGIFTAGFLNTFWALGIFLLIALAVPTTFVFETASLPTLIVRVVLGMLQAWLTIKAISLSDRSTFGFLHIWTIPLILIVDVVLGYDILALQGVGMILIVLSLVFLFINHGLQKKGIWYVLGSSLNAVFTISLYKYNIEHYNSVVAEMLISYAIAVLFFYFMARRYAEEDPLKVMLRPAPFIQSLSSGIGFGVIAFAYQFAPASVITSASRAGEVFWAMVAGQMHFHEKKFFVKIIALVLIIGGLVALALGST